MNPSDVAKWIDRKSVEITQRDGKAFVVATGEDSQMAARLAMPATGSKETNSEVEKLATAMTE